MPLSYGVQTDSRERTVREGLQGAWLRDCGLNLTREALDEFFLLWEKLREVHLDPSVADPYVWKWERDRHFSSRSAYKAFFAARTRAEGVDQIWRSRAPPHCRFFAWLVSKNRCWTADRLQRRGLPHPTLCPFCDQEQETIQHLLLGCVLAREVWASTLRFWGKIAWMPEVDSALLEWWTGRSAGRREVGNLWTALTLVF